jgi:hypothetical protein
MVCLYDSIKYLTLYVFVCPIFIFATIQKTKVHYFPYLFLCCLYFKLSLIHYQPNL